MVMRPDELVEPSGDGLAIDLIAAEGVATANDVLATSFGAPRELFDDFSAACAKVEEASWYVGRVDGELVATALGITVDDVTGVFNVATMPAHRGRGHGAALTARVVRDGFARGASLAYLQSSTMGHGLYRRLGFRDVEEYCLLTRPT
jgi:ribosomal protein S18 acetylase RimI-like enzyme